MKSKKEVDKAYEKATKIVNRAFKVYKATEVNDKTYEEVYKIYEDAYMNFMICLHEHCMYGPKI